MNYKRVAFLSKIIYFSKLVLTVDAALVFSTVFAKELFKTDDVAFYCGVTPEENEQKIALVIVDDPFAGDYQQYTMSLLALFVIQFVGSYIPRLLVRR